MPSLDNDSLEMVLSTLRAYADRALSPGYLLQLDADEEFPQTALDDLYDPEQVGLHLLFIPEAYGGLGGGAYDIYRVAETLAGIDLGISTSVLATFLGSDPIAVGGTEEQKNEWMGRIAEEGLLVAYGATEPQAGSDLSALRTKAEPVIEAGELIGYRLSGQKQWISNGGVAAVYTILALAPGGPSWFILERGAEGFEAGQPEDKHGIRASNTTSLSLDEVFVPVENLVGREEGQGLVQAQAVFGYTRLMVAAFGLGAGWAALTLAIRYSQARVQSGSALSEKAGFTHKLIVPNAARLEAARSYIEWTAQRLDAGEPGLATEGAIAKYMATEAGNKAAEDAIQAHGGYGYAREYMVEKIKRDVRITTIYEGTSEILEWTIARDRWQHHLKTRGNYYVEWAERLEALHGRARDLGADVAAMAMRSLATVLERCRLGRLTRNQHVLFRLGELIALAETAAVFAERLATEPSAASGLDHDTQKVLCRIHARDAALRVASDGLKWISAAGEPDAELAERLSLLPIYQAQAGLVSDLALAAEALNRAFPADSANDA